MNKDDMEIFFEALDGMPCAKENKCAENGFGEINPQ